MKIMNYINKKKDQFMAYKQNKVETNYEMMNKEVKNLEAKAVQSKEIVKLKQRKDEAVKLNEMAYGIQHPNLTKIKSNVGKNIRNNFMKKPRSGALISKITSKSKW